MRRWDMISKKKINSKDKKAEADAAARNDQCNNIADTPKKFIL
jgi:hypothetical protein